MPIAPKPSSELLVNLRKDVSAQSLPKVTTRVVEITLGTHVNITTTVSIPISSYTGVHTELINNLKSTLIKLTK